MMKKLHSAGNGFYGHEWDVKRPELVTAVTKKRTSSSKQLTFDECKSLIDGIERKANNEPIFHDADVPDDSGHPFNFGDN